MNSLKLFSFYMHVVACPKFGHPALISEFLNYALNKEFVVDVSISREKK